MVPDTPCHRLDASPPNKTPNNGTFWDSVFLHCVDKCLSLQASAYLYSVYYHVEVFHVKALLPFSVHLYVPFKSTAG